MIDKSIMGAMSLTSAENREVNPAHYPSLSDKLGTSPSPPLQEPPFQSPEQEQEQKLIAFRQRERDFVRHRGLYYATPSAAANSNARLTRPRLTGEQQFLNLKVGLSGHVVKFRVHACLLSHFSEYFRIVFKDKECTWYMGIDDIEAPIFGLLVHWLYYLKVEPDQSEYPVLQSLVKLWTVAEHLEMPELQNDTIDLIHYILRKVELPAADFVEAVCYAFEEYTPTAETGDMKSFDPRRGRDHLQQLLLVAMALRSTDWNGSTWNEASLDGLPQIFTLHALIYLNGRTKLGIGYRHWENRASFHVEEGRRLSA